MFYIQAGDTSDFDGYLIARATELLCKQKKNLEYAIVLPERRACLDRNETNPMQHDTTYGEEIMDVSAKVLRRLCPTAAMIIRGPLNQRNVIPHKIAFDENQNYGSLLGPDAAQEKPLWASLSDLASRIMDTDVTSIFLDVNGSVGYLADLGPEVIDVLGKKMKASNMPIVFMAGILAELEPKTLALEGRDPRSTMNAIYSPKGVRIILDIAKAQDIQVIFVSNNVCNSVLSFTDYEDVKKSLGLGLTGLLTDLCKAWYDRPHLKGKCVPFDWMSFYAMFYHDDETVKTEERNLMVGEVLRTLSSGALSVR
jgi:hypothetical protein